ncbi:hypothetical protein FD754_004913 [Muntiacus muntjak]|uniref:Uncharacterized protein n=1 Tax=Muntiacus muntjak TaxID=9888 RepID=A0A5N3WIB6_MUNMU|nr:hypothetical protein FD754_004913 [Muntiacus muntjak]
METSASATATDKKEVKSGILEGLAFPDPGRKASALAVATAAAAAAVAAQGGRSPRPGWTPCTREPGRGWKERADDRGWGPAVAPVLACPGPGWVCVWSVPSPGLW